MTELMQLPFTYPTRITNFYELINVTNSFTRIGEYDYGILGIGILIAVFFIIFISTLRFGSKTSFSVSTFICLMVSFMLGILNLVDSLVIIAFIILASFAAFFLIWER